ncbi:hypothetical protein NCC49_006016 [Naganishia albida]|nr:hypothetical protein NCC49_006016 [Naganishia albida]
MSLFESFVYTRPAAYASDIASFEKSSSEPDTAAPASDVRSETASFCGSCGRVTLAPPTADDRVRAIFAKNQRTNGWKAGKTKPPFMGSDEMRQELDICDKALDLLIKGQDAMINALADAEMATKSFDATDSRKKAAEKWKSDFENWMGRRKWLASILRDRGILTLKERPSEIDDAAMEKVDDVLG